MKAKKTEKKVRKTAPLIRYSTKQITPPKRVKHSAKRQRPRASYVRLGIVLGLLVCSAAAAYYYAVYKPHAHTARPAAVRPVRTVPKTPPATPLTAKAGKVEHDIPYCNDQKLDVYYPRTPRGSTAPVVIYAHGGGWLINDKSTEQDQLSLIDPLRDHGFIIVSIDYRKMPQAYFPAPVEDMLCAVRFLRAKAATYGVDVNHIGSHGFSAGGYLAAMAAVLDSTTAFNKGGYTEQSSRVQATSTLAGLLDFEHGLWPSNQDNIARFLQGVPVAEANPVTYLSPDDPPFLLIHGLRDQYVPWSQDESFSQALSAHDIPFETIGVSYADHGLNQLQGQTTSPSREHIRKRIADFYIEHFVAKSSTKSVNTQ